jgi:hypothetical protein
MAALFSQIGKIFIHEVMNLGIRSITILININYRYEKNIGP